MKFFTCLVVCAVVTATLLTGLLHATAACFGEEQDVFQLGRTIVFETRRTEALLHRLEMVGRSAETKRDTVAELFAARLTLAEAVDLFTEANQLVDNTDAELVAPYRVPTTTEGTYRQVLSWVRGSASLHPSEQTERRFVALVKEFESTFGTLEPMYCSLELAEKLLEPIE